MLMIKNSQLRSELLNWNLELVQQKVKLLHPKKKLQQLKPTLVKTPHHSLSLYLRTLAML